ncbi:MAG: hypothetical protein NT169_28575 [Chloroflexi bacterium]|nr:hypothetical protein [Chloroflexota bacterium]
MFKQAKDWVSHNSDFIQAITAIIQTIIAVLLLWTLIQSAQTLSITKRQLEASIEPVLDTAMFGSKLQLVNTGSIDIRNLEEIAEISGHFDLATQEISDYQIVHSRLPVHDAIKAGATFEIDLSQRLVVKPEVKSAESINVYCLVLRYRRAADMKPFIKLIPFQVGQDSKTQTADIFMPLFPSAGSAEGAIIRNGPWETIREELIKLYRTKVSTEDMG